MTGPCPEPARTTVEAGVRTAYREVARRAAGRFPYPVGRESLARLGYPPAALEGLPDAVVDRFVGVGNPFVIERPQVGDRVLDVGCGCGLDALVAARLVGPTGRVVGVDLTPEMLAVAHASCPPDLAAFVTFVSGSVLDLPLDDESIDVVLSNGVLNLVADKDAAFRELFRVLRPGGRLAVVDLFVVETVPREVLDDPGAWAT